MSRAKYMANYRERKKNEMFQDLRFKNKDFQDKCLNCDAALGERFRAKKPKKFCNNNRCQHEYNRKRAIDMGIAGSGSTKRHLIETRGYKCEKCGIDKWNDKHISLELDHIDGNFNDNSLNNVRLLCPNCHSQTETFKSKNIGKGRLRNEYSPKPFYPKLLDPIDR